MYPHERSLVKRLEDMPFALVGVNSDADKNVLKKAMEKQHITWRSFWNGPDGTSGPISEKWDVSSWPTIYVLDAKGTIRFKNVRGEAMDRAVDQLLEEMGKKPKKNEVEETKKSKAAEEVEALITAHEKALRDFYKNHATELKNAKNNEELAKINKARPNMDEMRAKLWDMVEKNPNDQQATFPALQWLLGTYYNSYDSESQKARAKILDLLIKDHADNPKIGPLLSNLTFYVRYSLQAEELLRAVRAKNSANEAKGIACFNLGLYLKRDAEGIRRLKDSPREGKNIEGFLGKEDAQKLEAADPEKLAKEAESVLEEAAAQYGDVLTFLPAFGTIADQAGRELFELRDLTVGKTVPEIAGDDLDGKPFKLSDYRGKVVVLDFWNGQYAPGRSKYAANCTLVKRYEGKPFALVGVYRDADKEELRKTMEKENAAWRSFSDGSEMRAGPISKQWNVRGQPTTYILDAKGTIRFKNVWGKDLDRAVDQLFKEMEKDVAK
jgi:peroxiredoxin